MRSKIRLTLVISTVALLSACGGGSGSTPTVIVPSAQLQSISGIAASGAAMSGATISAQCQGSSSPVTGTANDDGSYQLTLPAGTTAPCLISASATDSTGLTQTYYSAIASDASSSNPVANITPITHLVLSNAMGAEPTASTNAQTATSQLTNSKISAAAAIVQSSLSTTFGVSSDALGNPFSVALTVAQADSGLPPSAQDSAIDQVMGSLNVASKKLSDLANTLSSATTAATATTSLQNLATQNGIPTSAASNCPFATSGLYAFANVGASNMNNGSNNNTPSFMAVKIDFKDLTALTGSGDLGRISQPNLDNPCQFQVAFASQDIVNLNLQVSRSGFIVLTGFAPPDPSAVSVTQRSAGNGCFSSYCSGFLMGFPVQTGMTLNDLKGTWQSVEWNLEQYYNNGPGALTGSPNALSTTPCSGFTYQIYTGTTGTGCQLYVNYARQFKIDVPPSAPSTVWVYGCNGLGQGGITRCSTQSENTSALTLVMCSDNGDCPTVTYKNGPTSTTVNLTSVMDIMQQDGTVVARSLAFRAPNNDIIGVFVAGPGGPNNPDAAHSGNFNGNEFQEQFGIMFRPASAAVAPTAGSVMNNPQWALLDLSSSILSATVTRNTMTDVTVRTGSNPLALGQIFYSANKLLTGTTITQINGVGNSTTYTLYCGGATECRSNTASSSLSNLFAFSQVVRESTVVYQVGQVSTTAPFSFGRTYTDRIDAGQSDQIVLDSPYFGMARRPYVPAAGSAPMMNEGKRSFNPALGNGADLIL